MAWVYIFLAGLIETSWPFVLKKFSNVSWAPLAICLASMIPVFYLLSFAMKSLPAGTVYLASIVIGSIGVTLVGIFIFHESANMLRLASLALAIIGVIGLKYFGAIPS
ncbi:MAG: SMR family transporter [Alphaproteobacteria bacterium]|nr:SMR family transporter [Alphaproteobacteria bacterium]